MPVILNLNMMDVFRKRDMKIDVDALSRQLGIPVVPTCMKSGRGKQEMRDAIARTAAAPRPAPTLHVH